MKFINVTFGIISIVLFSCSPDESSSIREDFEPWSNSYQVQLLNNRLESDCAYQEYKQNVYYSNLCHLWMYLQKDLYVSGLEEFYKERDYESEFFSALSERINQKKGIPRLNADYLLELYFTIWLDCKIYNKKDDEKLREIIILMCENGYLSLRDFMDPYNCFIIKYMKTKGIKCVTPHIYWMEHLDEYGDWSSKFCLDMIKQMKYLY